MDEKKYDILKQEVDSIQIQLAKGSGPWYSKPSNLISLFALLFSFGTTIASFYNAHLQDMRDNRREARALIQRLSKLPLENYDLLQKYKGVGSGEALAGMINQENILLATQAAEMIERYPETFSSTEYFSVAVALSTSNIVRKVPGLFRMAIEKADNSNDYNVSTRAFAAFLFAKGELSEGRRYYEMALNVWDRFPERNLYIINSVDMVTLMYWAQAEMGANNPVEAWNKFEMAEQKLNQLSPGPYTDSLRNQLLAVEEVLNLSGTTILR